MTYSEDYVSPDYTRATPPPESVWVPLCTGEEAEAFFDGQDRCAPDDGYPCCGEAEAQAEAAQHPLFEDAVNHPTHYLQHESGVECIAITEQFNFCVGNAIKYLWRAGLKGERLEDLRKAQWYVAREIDRLERKANQ